MIVLARALIALITGGTLAVVIAFTFFTPPDLLTVVSWLSMSVALFHAWDMDCMLADAGRPRG